MPPYNLGPASPALSLTPRPHHVRDGPQTGRHGQRRRDTREHVALYLKAFNAWAGGEPLSTLRFTVREPVPAVSKIT